MRDDKKPKPEEYLVITSADQVDLQDNLNAYAVDGWKLVSFVYITEAAALVAVLRR